MLSISIKKTRRYASLFLAYLEQQPVLDKLYPAFPNAKAFASQIAKKSSFALSHRQTLQRALQRQYASMDCPTPIAEHIDALAHKNTFVVCTGQQIHPFLGPAYVLFKLLRTIRLAAQLQKTYPKYRFVPMFWMHTEDHDVNEINHLYWCGQRYEIDFPKHIAGCLPTEALRQFADLFPAAAFHAAYAQEKTLGAATRLALASLFGEQGLVVLDPQDKALKALAVDLFSRVLFEPQPLVQALNDAGAALRGMGYTPALTAHNIRLFHLTQVENNCLERHAIHQTETEIYTPLQQFTQQSLRATVEQHPDQFSPAVGIRPLYQELILPNLAYVAGPGEQAYWLQLGGLFEEVQLPMPLLVPRPCGMWLQPAQAKWMQKNNIAFEQLFSPPSTLRTAWMGITPLDIAQEQDALEQVFSGLQQRTQKLDTSLQGYLGRQHAQAQALLLRFQDTLLKRMQQKKKPTLRALTALHQTCFPQGQLQERILASMACFSQPSVLQTIAQLDAFDFAFHGWVSKPVADAVC